LSENRAIYEIIWGKYCTTRHATNDDITRRMRIACCITKATNAHSEYVIIIAFSKTTKVMGTRTNITLYLHKTHNFIYDWIGYGAKMAARVNRDAEDSPPKTGLRSHK
jgi:hypothetical protein